MQPGRELRLLKPRPVGLVQRSASCRGNPFDPSWGQSQLRVSRLLATRKTMHSCLFILRLPGGDFTACPETLWALCVCPPHSIFQAFLPAYCGSKLPHPLVSTCCLRLFIAGSFKAVLTLGSDAHCHCGLAGRTDVLR